MSIVKTLVNWLENISNRPNIIAAADAIAVKIHGASALPMLDLSQTGNALALSVTGQSALVGDTTVTGNFDVAGAENLVGTLHVTGSVEFDSSLTPAGGITGPLTLNGNVTMQTGSLHVVTGSVTADESAFVTGGLTVSGDSGFTSSSSPVITVTQSSGVGVALQTLGAIAIAPPSAGSSLTTSATNSGTAEVWSLTQTGSGRALGVSTDVGVGIFVTAVSGTAISAFSSLVSGSGVAVSGETHLGTGVQGISTGAAGVGVSAQGTGNGLALDVQGNASFAGGLVTLSSFLNLTPVTFAGLPVSPAGGVLAVVTDATVNTWGSAVTVGGGGDEVLVWYNGAAWTVFGK